VKIKKLKEKVIRCAIEAHKSLELRFLESVCEQCLVKELKLAGIDLEIQAPLSVEHKGTKLQCEYQIDFLAEKESIIEFYDNCVSLVTFMSQELYSNYAPYGK
jgi:GxxExxY protein